MNTKTTGQILREILEKRAAASNATLATVAAPAPAESVAVVKTADAPPLAAEQTPAQAAQEHTVATVNAEAKINSEVTQLTEQQEIVDTKIFDKRIPTAYVTVKAGMTINLGNFNNGKVDVSISVPVGFEITEEYKQKVNSAYEFGKAFTESKVREQAKKLTDFAKSRQ